MKINLTKIAIPVVVAVAALTLSASPAAAQLTEGSWSDDYTNSYDGLVYNNPCITEPDPITLTGNEKVHYDYSVAKLADGGFQCDLKIRSNHVNVKGLSKNGIEYVAPGNWHLTYSKKLYGNDIGLDYKFFSRCPLISKGSEPNLHNNVHWKVKVAADGTVTFDRLTVDIKCTGGQDRNEKAEAGPE